MEGKDKVYHGNQLHRVHVTPFRRDYRTLGGIRNKVFAFHIYNSEQLPFQEKEELLIIFRKRKGRNWLASSCKDERLDQFIQI
jgi:hypothetical protein